MSSISDTPHDEPPATPRLSDRTVGPEGLQDIDRVERLKPGSDPGSPEYEALGWKVWRHRSGESCEKLFRDEAYGGTALALRAAIAFRDGPA